MPDDIGTRDVFHGAGGAEMAPSVGAAYTWVSTDTGGYSLGYTVRGSDGRTWDVKVGPEAQSEVVASRIHWAAGYHQPITYYVADWQLTGGPGGRQPGARFRLESDDVDVSGDWSWSDNDFVGTQPYRGLIVLNVLINNWDWKTSNNKIHRLKGGAPPAQRFVVQDLGAALGRTEPSRLLWLLPVPMRGFGQGTRNNIDHFEAQGFIKRVDESDVEFDFHTIYGHVLDLVRPADVRWTSELLNRLTDEQWQAALDAAGYSPEIRTRYIKKIKAKIAEGLAVS